MERETECCHNCIYASIMGDEEPCRDCCYNYDNKSKNPINRFVPDKGIASNTDIPLPKKEYTFERNFSCASCRYFAETSSKCFSCVMGSNYEPETKTDELRHIQDNVNHPSHYTTGDIEVIDYIRDKLSPYEFQGYCMGNVLKYVSRWRHKGGVEDLKKANVYLGWMIESAEGIKPKETIEFWGDDRKIEEVEG